VNDTCGQSSDTNSTVLTLAEDGENHYARGTIEWPNGPLSLYSAAPQTVLYCTVLTFAEYEEHEYAV